MSICQRFHACRAARFRDRKRGVVPNAVTWRPVSEVSESSICNFTLEERKGPVDLFVRDRADRPDAN